MSFTRRLTTITKHLSRNHTSVRGFQTLYTAEATTAGAGKKTKENNIYIQEYIYLFQYNICYIYN
jgi:hypothetical protein